MTYELSEEEILNLCPEPVHKISKVRSSKNMVIFTFFGSFLPDSIRIGPLRLKVKPFLDRPLQCYGCYKYGHGRKNCTESPRCGNCSALDSHSTDDCESNSYCFHCRDAHPVRSRQCPQYRLEQDILHLANSQFISLGSARRELAFRQSKGGEAKSFASSLKTPSSVQSLTKVSTNQPPVHKVSSRSSKVAATSVSTSNMFSLLSGETEETSIASETNSDVKLAVVAEAQDSNPQRHHTYKPMQKRHYSSTDSLEVRPSKIPTSNVDRRGSNNRSVVVVSEDHYDSPKSTSARAASSSSLCRVTPIDASAVSMDVSHDIPLVDEDMPNSLGRQMSQESLASMASDRSSTKPTSNLTSRSGTATCREKPDYLTKFKHPSKAESPRPGTSRESVSSRVGPSATTKIRRNIKLPSHVYVSSGKSPPGAHPKPFKK